jgi:hypothetical protein
MQVSGGVAEVVVLGCKASIAVLLLAAGGAKAADLRAFAGTVRLFVPDRLPAGLPLALAGGIACAELGAGAASLSVPQAGWLNGAVLVICAGFLGVSALGYARHRGRPCQCFGALTKRGFTAAALARAAGLVVASVLATASVPAISIGVSLGWRLALLAGGALVVAGASSAAAAARAAERPGPRWA